MILHFIYVHWIELTLGLVFFYTIWILAMTVRNYQMLVYLTGGRTWGGRFKRIREQFARIRKARRNG